MNVFDKPTRLKDTRKGDVLVSIKSYLANEGTLVIYNIDLNDKTVYLYKKEDNDNYTLIDQSTYKKFSQARPTAKKLLKKYGVLFMDEVRNKPIKRKSHG